MANISVSDNPQLNLKMEAMETTTPAHCDQWNGKHQQLLNNDKYLSTKIEETATSTGKKMDKTAVVDDLDAVLAVTEDKVPVGSKAIQKLNSNLSERINSGLSAIDIRYNAETGAPEWSPRGADSWSPFSGGLPDLTTASTRVSSDLVFPNKTDTQNASVAKSGKRVVGVKSITNLSPQTVAYGWSLNTETQVITVTFYNNQVSGAYAYCDVICLYMDV